MSCVSAVVIITSLTYHDMIRFAKTLQNPLKIAPVVLVGVEILPPNLPPDWLGLIKMTWDSHSNQPFCPHPLLPLVAQK